MTIYRDRLGKPYARTDIELDLHGVKAFLRIETSKIGPNIDTDASVQWPTPGGGRVHRFGLNRHGVNDFRRLLIQAGGRATEQKVLEQHARVDVAAVTAAARAHYPTPDHVY